ncbi:biotin--[acetyl-CoA-carboxylase] ligase [Pseudorhodoplanes sp.]|uniref:biotin--[acetyl-CoA-carboxylase] ligase n=1 Tax=Pseudorhodoplanes sp. TaxID=1934341 RepID=UPI00391D462E
MAFALGPKAAQAGHGLIVHDSLDSTNSEALRQARSGERGPLWIVAREQTAGRGRRGRQWMSAKGNLMASLLLALPVTPAVAATLGFVASLAVSQTCRELTSPKVHFSLKWPNDVLADGGKVAGLLLESEAHADDLAVAVGFGVNLAEAPSGMPYPAQSLAALGHVVTPEEAFSRLTDAWLSYAALWNEGLGFDAIREAWLAQARGIGQAISVRTGERMESGIFETLDEEGRLILRKTDGMIRVFTAGDVYFGDVTRGGGAS